MKLLALNASLRGDHGHTGYLINKVFEGAGEKGVACISSKQFVPLVCSNNIEDLTPNNTISYFHTYSRFMDTPQIGSLTRNGGLIAGYGKDPARQHIFPKLKEVNDAYVEAGRELATRGYISRSTQKKANQEILTIPMFNIMKKIGPFKSKFVDKARLFVRPSV
ncbi:MAG: hypothetical protein JXA01_00350 [Dehalococcoidia bacterium]|nr:hypothetical protein [Dehalococcoidia bacterium]